MSALSVSHAGRSLLWLVLGGIILLVLGGIGLGIWMIQQINASAGDLTPQQIERSSFIQLPPSASDIRSHVVGFREKVIYVRFAIDAADVPSFLASTRITQPLSATRIPPQIAVALDRPWWTPQQAQRFQAGEGMGIKANSTSYSQSVLIDTTGPQRYTVYLVTFHM